MKRVSKTFLIPVLLMSGLVFWYIEWGRMSYLDNGSVVTPHAENESGNGSQADVPGELLRFADEVPFISLKKATNSPIKSLFTKSTDPRTPTSYDAQFMSKDVCLRIIGGKVGKFESKCDFGFSRKYMEMDPFPKVRDGEVLAQGITKQLVAKLCVPLAQDPTIRMRAKEVVLVPPGSGSSSPTAHYYQVDVFRGESAVSEFTCRFIRSGSNSLELVHFFRNTLL